MGSVVIVIPARLHSTRLPQKLLLADTGKPVLQHTFEAASRSRRADRVIVATDAQPIVDLAAQFGATALLTDPQAASGTDRVAEVARQLPEADVVVNVQGDEPEIDPAVIDVAITMLDDPTVNMATLATPIKSLEQAMAPSCVKVVCDKRGDALYFSRSVIPHVRDGLEEAFHSGKVVFLQHLGLYAYRKPFLLQLAQLPASPLEQLEKLEQLRVLHAGHRIRVGVVQHAAVGIDTQADYEAFVERWRTRQPTSDGPPGPAPNG
jgi:3-deoxy-manno-octulosonate cytidylyltransferase (CMP-KDO synthetase)